MMVRFRSDVASWAGKVGRGELCGVREDGVTSFELMQQASDAGHGGLVHFAFDLLHLDGEDVSRLWLLERKARLAGLLKQAPEGIVYSEHGAAPARHSGGPPARMIWKASSPSAGIARRRRSVQSSHSPSALKDLLEGVEVRWFRYVVIEARVSGAKAIFGMSPASKGD